jgi:hypothetical protein
MILAGLGLVVLRAVLLEQTGKDVEVFRGHIHDLKPHVEGSGVDLVGAAPATPGREDHEVLGRHVTAQLHAEAEVCVWLNGAQAVQLEASRAEVHQMSHKFTGGLIHHPHIERKVPPIQFSPFRSHAASFRWYR